MTLKKKIENMCYILKDLANITIKGIIENRIKNIKIYNDHKLYNLNNILNLYIKNYNIFT